MKRYHKNPRQITTKQLDLLSDTLDELGDLSGIVHDLNSDEIIGGNMRSDVFNVNMCEIELTHQGDEPDAQGTVAHGFIMWKGKRYAYRQVRWTPSQCEKANIVANKGGGTWDFDILANEFDMSSLLEWGFEPFDFGIDDIAEEQSEPADAEPQISRADELLEVWQVKTGDIWKIGEHRLACGDCTDAATVARLMDGEKADMMFTDPPYGIKRDKGFEGFEGFGGFGPPIARRQYADDWDGDRPSEEAFDLLLSNAKKSIIFGGNFFADLLPQSKHWIVWDKLNTMPTFGDCELAWTDMDRTSVKKYTVQYNGLVGKEKERFHPTQKPVAIFAAILTDYTDEGMTVFEPYAGSGTCVVACENLHRRCRAIEISPAYVSVILQRMQDAFPSLTIERA